MYDLNEGRRTFVYAHPFWTKMIIFAVVAAVFVAAFVIPNFAALLGILFFLFMLGVMAWAIVSIVYSCLEGLVPEYKRPRRRDR